MDRESAKIYIIGAGISGLTAAKTLTENGYHPFVMEATGGPGGRVKTDKQGGLYYDHGFQVLLTAYPQAQKHLDYSELNLHRFKPGAMIFYQGEVHRIGDPLRDLESFWPTMKASVGTLSDKWKIFRLASKLKKKSIEAIFSSQATTTLEYLKDYGFSDRIIQTFFKPFFTGIFLEKDLRTSSRMFEFTFKMFSEGEAALPDAGIGAISNQLAASLKHCQFHYMEPVARVSGGKVVMQDGETLEADGVVTTIPLDPESGEPRPAAVPWKRCDNLYFATASREIPEGIIGLVADADTLVNNLYYPFGQCIKDRWLLSVTVVGAHGLSAEDLEQRVREELQTHCGIETLELLRHYPIEKALPDLDTLTDSMTATQSRISEGIFAAGDYQLNGSLNAAMASGEQAAEALMQALEARA